MIGVFDSGFGGLSLVNQLLQFSPQTSVIYFGDHQHNPYGDKPRQFIIDRSAQIVDWLVNQGCTSILIGCNTATALAISSLRRRFSLPITGVEPAVKPLSRHPASPKVILATQNTLRSARYRSLIRQFDPHRTIQAFSFPHWVTTLEAGNLTASAVANQLKTDLESIPPSAVVSVSCTHYIFYLPLIARHRPDLHLYNPNSSVARQALSLALPGSFGCFSLHVYSSAFSPTRSQLASNLLQRHLQVKSISI